MINNSFLQKSLEDLEAKELLRELRTVEGAQGPRVYVQGKEYLNFCSNNYLGLASDSRLIESAMNGLRQHGFGSGASRLVCGNMASHTVLEKKIAAFKGTEACLLFSTGYMANIGILSSLFGRQDVLFADRLNHASLIDGALMSQAKIKRYPHKNMDALESMLQQTDAKGRKAIITDSVFSMDGDIAPLDKIVQLAEDYNCLVMIDEAHAFGVMGEQGKGLAEHFHLEDKIDIQMGTLSKASGSFGAYCCGSQQLISFLINKARSFIYTTGMPPAVAEATCRAIDIIREQPEIRRMLWDNVRYVREALQDLGFDTLDSCTPIIPLMVKEPKVAVELSQRLFAQGIFISAIRPPTVPAHTARLRLTVMSSHTRDELDHLIHTLKTIGKELCLI